MAKKRIPIPDHLEAKVMFAADRTCCVCRISGKTVQIHHIDGKPSNNALENLVVLCLECHNETHLKGGFGRKLNPPLVAEYRNHWLEAVKLRRDLATERAITREVGEVSISQQLKATPRIKVQHTQLKDFPADYINSLPKFKSDLLQQTRKQKELDSTTYGISQANRDYADSLTGILVVLANYYSPACFGSQSPQEFFSEIISARSRFHSMIAEPYGPGTGGTIVPIRWGLSLIADIEKIIEDMVHGLWEERYSEYEDWRKRWRSESI